MESLRVTNKGLVGFFLDNFGQRMPKVSHKVLKT
jgi:hypothetical protein